MGRLSDLFVRIKGDNKDLKSTLDDSGKDVEKFGGKMKGLASAGGSVSTAFLAVLAVWGAWAKNQTFGLDMVNKALSITKQYLNDIFSQQQVNFREYARIADEENRIRNEDRKDAVWIAKLRRDTRAERLKSLDPERSLDERLKSITIALERQRELEAYIKADLQKKLNLVEQRLVKEKTNITLLEERKRLRVELLNADESESIRLIGAQNALLADQKKRAEDLVDAFTELRITRAGMAITNNLSPSVGAMPIDKEAVGITANFAKGKRAGLQGTNIDPAAIDKANGSALKQVLGDEIDEVTQMLQDGIMSISQLGGDLAEGLGAALSGANMKDLGKGLLMSFANFISQFGRMLIAYGIAKLAFFESLKGGTLGAGVAIAAGVAMLAAAGAVKGALSKGGGAMGGGGSYGGGGGQGISTQQMKVIVEGRIKGKDIYISNRRYEETQR